MIYRRGFFAVVLGILWSATSCLYWNPLTQEDPSGNDDNPVTGDFPLVWDSTPAGDVPSDAGIRINFPSGRAAAGEELVLTGTSGGTITWLLAAGTLDTPPAGALWSSGLSPATFTLSATGTFTLFAGYNTTAPLLRQKIRIDTEYPAWEELACNAENSHILFWASGVTGRTATDATSYTDTSEALGAAGSDPTRVLALGNGGSVTLTFSGTVTNGPGPDFAVFENGLLYGDGSVFAELAFVEVSSDGVNFARFPTASLPGGAIGTYDAVPQGSFYGYAGGAPCGYGVLFDLNGILNTEAVLEGLVDPGAITHIRITDADSTSGGTDSFGRPVRDPLGTWGPSGFDLDGVGILNGVQP